MGKKYWKQIATFMLVFILIFQNSATILMVAATSTDESNTVEDNTNTSDNEDIEDDTQDGITSEEEDADTDNEDEANANSDSEDTANTEANTDTTDNEDEANTTETSQTDSTTQSTSQPEEAVTTSGREDTTTEGSDIGEQSFIIDGVTYEISDGFSQEQIPAYFSLTSLEHNGNIVTAVKFDNGELYLLYLVEEGSYTGDFYIYDQESKSAYPFQTVGGEESYLILLNTPKEAVVPEGFAETSLLLDGTTRSAYRFNATTIKSTNSEAASNEETGNENENTTSSEQSEESSETSTSSVESMSGKSTLSTADFYLVYAMSSKGYEGWFQYDAGEGTYLRYVSYEVEEDTVQPEELEAVQAELNSLNQQYDNEMKKRLFIISGLIILEFIFIIIITGLIFKVKDLKGNNDWDDDDDEDWNDDYDYDVDDEEDYNEEIVSKEDQQEDLNDDADDESEKNVQEEFLNEKNNQKFVQNSRTPQPAMHSDLREKNSILAENITPNMEISAEGTIMDESELAREVAKAMNGETQKLTYEKQESSDDNFNFEFVDLD